MQEKDPVADYATTRFGIKYLYPYQRLVVANVLDSMDETDERDTPNRQLVILPTGAGKSLCFQLPAPLCPGPTVVVYPLLGLMADQKRRLESSGVGVAVLKGGMTETERSEAFESISSGKAQVIITNPETLAVPVILDFLGRADVFHFVIDEAHCVAEWGDGFRPAYLLLGNTINAIKPKVITAFTATASPPILERVVEILFGTNTFRLIAGSPDRPNIRYEVRPTLSMQRAVREAVSSLPKPAIVFAISRPGVEILAEDLRSTIPGVDARFYHAGLEKTERNELENWFMASSDGVLCSTCAYGMGMDKSNIRTVIHYGIPASVEAYLQESGRAGRDGETSYAVLIRKASPEDYHGTVETFPEEKPLEKDGDEKTSLAKARARAMELYAHGSYACRRTFLLNALGYEGAETMACPSCDLCDGVSQSIAPGSNILLETFRRHARRFRSTEATAFLTGQAGTLKAAFHGSLIGWRTDEVAESIESLITAKLVMTIPHGLWKGRLKLRGAAQSGRTSSSSRPSAESSSVGGSSGALVARLLGRRVIRGELARHGSAT